MTAAPVATTGPAADRRPGPALGTARMADGTILRTLRWEAPGEPWAACEIVHGLGEHGGRYQTVADALTAAGIDTWAYDQRGNGGSGGPRVYVDHWSILHDDLEARLHAVRDRNPRRPLVLWGHSLGGLVAAGYVLSPVDRLRPDLLVLSSPGLGDNQPGWQRPLARVLSRLVPKLRIANSLPAGGLSRDDEVHAGAAADPLCTDRSTVRWGAEAFREQDRVNGIPADLSAMPVPTYVFHGAADPIVPVDATAVFEGMGNVTRHVHDGLRHECHHEPEQDHVLREAVEWIEATAGRAAPV